MSSPIDYPKALNREQLDVVLHGDGPCLVLAGAGSGKTRTLTYRVAYLIEKGVQPDEILLLTFTNKSAKEMIERVEGVLGAMAHGIWGGTFHSIGARFLRMHAESLGFTRGFSILDADDAKELIKAIMKDAGVDSKDKRFPSKNVVADLISYSRNTLQNLVDVIEQRVPHFLHTQKEILHIAEQYQKRKREANVMDFDDLLTYFTGLAEDPLIGERISRRFRYVLVDEYQDTNAVQARLVKALSRVHANLLVVGDDAQSIYGFRGADVQNILAFPNSFSTSKTFKLLTNYRSTPEILALANASLEHNEDQFLKELQSFCPSGEKPRLLSCASATQEARAIADEIAKAKNRGELLQTIAVLFRSSAHSQTLEFELMKREIPFEYRGGQTFFERAHIKDVLAFLRVIQNHKDEIAWLRVLSLQPGIGATTAAQLTQALTSLESLTALSMIEVPKRAQEGFRALTVIIEEAISGGIFPASVIRSVIRSSYQTYLEQEYPNYRDRLEDLEQLAIFAEGYEQLDLFLQDIALYDEVAAKRQQAERGTTDRIVLSTIHQAKGLEWDKVYVIHVTNQSFPSSRAVESEQGIEEERRLFYVAVTRAKKQLTITYPMTMGYDSLSFCQPSIFLEEVSSTLFDKIELRDHVSSAGPRSFRSWQDDDDDDFRDESVIEIDSWGNRKKSSKPTSQTIWKKK